MTPQEQTSAAEAAKLSGKKSLRVGSKITLLSFSMVALTIIILIAIVFIQKSRLTPTLGRYLDEQAYEEAGKLVATFAQNCAAADAQSQRLLDHDLDVARDLIQTKGTISLLSETVAWDAEDQVTHQKAKVMLPK